MISICIEVLNFAYIVFATEPLDLIQNFVALYIIAEMDTYYCQALPATIKLKYTEEMEEVLLRVHTTTLKNAREKLEQNKFDSNIAGVNCDEAFTVKQEKEEQCLSWKAHDVPKYIFVDWKDRRCGMKIAYIFFKLVKTIYVAFWYYFAPYYGLYWYLYANINFEIIQNL